MADPTTSRLQITVIVLMTYRTSLPLDLQRLFPGIWVSPSIASCDRRWAEGKGRVRSVLLQTVSTVCILFAAHPFFLRRGCFWKQQQYGNFGSKNASQSRELQRVTCMQKRVYLWANYHQEILFSLKSSHCNSTCRYQMSIWPHNLFTQQ